MKHRSAGTSILSAMSFCLRNVSRLPCNRSLKASPNATSFTDTNASDARLYVSGSLIDRGLTTEIGVPLRIYDTSDSAAPRAIGEFDDLAGPVSGIATDGTLAYVIDHPYFRVLDVSSTVALRELSSIRFDNLGDRVRLLGKQLIIYGRGDVQLLDVSNPYAPRLAKVWHSQGSPPSNAAFLRDTIIEGNPFSGLHVVDFINFSDPTQIGGIKNHYFEVVADGADVAYVSYQGNELVAVNVAVGDGSSGNRSGDGVATLAAARAGPRRDAYLLAR